MSNRIGSPCETCECWAPVVGTILILVGIFDLGFGAAIAAASIELGQLAGEVEASSGLIKIGHTLSQVTGGLLQFGSAEQGAVVKEVLGELPPVWISLLLAVGRILLAMVAVVLGVALARRFQKAVLPLSRWAIVAAGWGLISMLFSIGLYSFIGKTSGVAAAGITVLLDLALHVIWPLAVLWRIRLARIL
ncbi:MAG: hypothetical protein QF534_02910 [Phycisphaerales bacterium]|nr:hypothetical protein [Phycisphaerales bacterium]